MLSKLDEMRLDKEELELEQTIAHFMENKEDQDSSTYEGILILETKYSKENS